MFQVNGTYLLIFKRSSAYFITLRYVSVSKYPQIKFLFSRRHIVWQTEDVFCSGLWHASTYQSKHLGLKTFHLVNRYLSVAKVKGVLKTSVANGSAVFSCLLSDAKGRMLLQISICYLCNPKFLLTHVDILLKLMKFREKHRLLQNSLLLYWGNVIDNH